MEVTKAPRKTKIVATLGPASIPKIRSMIVAGVNVFRLNFSHVKDPTTQNEVINTIRRHSRELSIPVAIMGDLCGPKVRCNAFTPLPSITLITGNTVILKAAPSTEMDKPGDPETIMTPIYQIIEGLEVGHRVLLDDGYIELKVLEKHIDDKEKFVKCKIVTGGVLKPKKGINVPDIKLSVDALTPKDKIDARYMFKRRLDYVALSFVQHAKDVQDLLDLFEECRAAETKAGTFESTGDDSLDAEDKEVFSDPDWRPFIISKIEKPQALQCIDEIIKLSNGVMVARGDLGVEVSLHQVPIIQKMLISKCNAAEKPVITATQMLESMINNPSPTRAECSDVANAVLDGSDGIMLSAESATGNFPTEAVKIMDLICRSAENGKKTGLNFEVGQSEEFLNKMKQFRTQGPNQFTHSVSDSAFAAAVSCGAKALIVFTSTGDLAIYVSKRRGHIPVISITHVIHVYRRLALLSGVHPILSDSMKNDGIMLRNSDVILARAEHDIIYTQEERENDGETEGGRIVAIGDIVVFAAGTQLGLPGLSNTIKFSRFGNALKSSKARLNWSKLNSLTHALLDKDIMVKDK